MTIETIATAKRYASVGLKDDMRCNTTSIPYYRFYYHRGGIDLKVIEMKNICKSFGSLKANENVNFDLEQGEMHALLGENGAGKSTLMSQLYGMYHNDSGEIFVNGEKVDIVNPTAAIEHSIGMVHQHFMLIPQLNVTQNIYLGMKEAGFVFKKDKLMANVKALNDKYGFNVDPSALIWQLPVGVQQKVEILKVLIRKSRIIILDEPTAVLTAQEVDELFDSLRRMASEGYSIILITHKMREAIDFCDRITVMRSGKVVSTINARDTTEDELAEMMVGRSVNFNRMVQPQERGSTLFELRNVSIKHDKGHMAVKHADLELHSGEIVGIAGVDGNGQLELGEAIFGLRRIAQGEVYVDGEKIARNTPDVMIAKGMAHIPDDRHKKGLVMDFSTMDNLILGFQRSPKYSRSIFCKRTAIAENAAKLKESYDIRCHDITLPVRGLSGGNQQKVILARVLDSDPKVIIAIQPTRGLDVGAAEFMHRKLVEERAKGKAVLLISTDLDEILTISDRIHVMFNGELSESLSPEVPIQQLGLMMTGGNKKGA